MTDIIAASAEIAASFDGGSFPAGFLEKYEPLECLCERHGTETFLVRQKGTEQLFVAKCFDRSESGPIAESGILKSLSFDGLPAFADEFQDGNAACVVREYIYGTPLDKYAAENALSREEIVGICVKLCDILTYLHKRESPVIHRDIKPQNIIIREGGKIALIDFDISRTFTNGADTDTRFIGTRVYAPPEQYGFSQTDCRTDIYSLGVLLRWLLTGSAKEDPKAEICRPLAKIIKKCTAFSPRDRFPDAEAVKRALLRSDGRRCAAALRGASLLFALLAAACIGFAIGRYSELFSSPASAKAVSFSEPVIEKAVRIQLGKADGEAITEAELLTVRAIYIFGDEVSKTGEEFEDGLGGALKVAPRGTITSLTDVLLLPNLETLYVNYQTLQDISPLSGLENLSSVNLRHTWVSDVSALSGMAGLSDLCLFDTNVSDVTCLNACPRLRNLDIGSTLIPSVDHLCGFDTLTGLSVRKLGLSSLSGFERFSRLESLDISENGLTDLTPLLSMENLKTVYADESLRAAASAIMDRAAFEITYE